MLNSKLNINRIGWLDLVFENRNKNYGAYELRLKYSKTLLKALFLGSFLFAGLISAVSVYSRNENVPAVIPVIKDNLVKITDVVLPLKEKILPSAMPKTVQTTSAPKVQTKKFLPLRVVAAPIVTEDIPSVDELKNSLISSLNSDGKPSAANASPAEPSAGSGIAGNDEEKVFTAVEKAPQFNGGIQEFYKYLSRNLRYPSQAVENGISGRVIVSFVVERNGELSNIKILKGIGYGCDEEAIRVLKHSPVWEAGVQNGRKVRVQFTMPLAFNLSD